MSDQSLKTHRWRQLRKQILIRDDKTCGYCGDPDANTVDHIQPVSVRPDLAYDPANLVACCQLCNNRKTDKIMQRASWIRPSYARQLRSMQSAPSQLVGIDPLEADNPKGL